jgi:long-chain acyl-CoA synthetase
MGAMKQFKTLPEMFFLMTREFRNLERPVYMRKVKGKYEGIKYSEYYTYVKRVAMGLASIGIKEGDRVAIVSENRLEWTISDMAIISSGCITVPLFPSLTAKQIEFIFNDAQVKLVIVSNQFQLNKILKIKENVPSLQKVIIMNEKYDIQENILKFSDILRAGEHYEKENPDFLERAISGRKPDEVVTIIYTSGTTGDPKGVMLTNNNFASQIFSVSQIIDFNKDDIFLSFLPLSHVFERMVGYLSFSSGSIIAYAESIESVSENMLEVKPTIITTVPRLFERIQSKINKTIDSSPSSRQKIFHWAMEIGKKYAIAKKSGLIPLSLKTKHKLADKLVFSKLKERTGGRIKFFVSGGAALPKELGVFFDAIGLAVLEGYGLTETSPVIAVNKVEDYKFGTVGRPIPGVEVKIASDGEILTRGPHVMKGYYNNQKATEEAIDQDRWFHTGDIGFLDAEGFLTITDRKKHLFVSSGGKNIAPQAIENLFLSSKYIDQFVLIGDRRQFLSAIIVPDFDAIKEFADTHNIEYTSVTDLANSEEIYKIIENDIGKIQQDLANYERVRKFVLLDKPLTLEDGEITPTQKIKRKVVEEKYANMIEEMYRISTKQ